MRRFLLTILIALAAGCTLPAARCDLHITRDLSFSGMDANDTITARASGPSCDKAIGVYEIRAADGYPIWAWAAPLSHRFGDVFAPNEPDAMRDFLARWAQPNLGATHSAPAWASLEPGQTTLDQVTYDDIRARDLPMLCHASGTGRETCIFWEPAAGGAGHFYDRDMEGI